MPKRSGLKSIKINRLSAALLSAFAAGYGVSIIPQAAVAQEGWPQSEWDAEARPTTKQPNPAPYEPQGYSGSASEQPLRQMPQMPKFGDPRVSAGRPQYQDNSANSSFAAPTAVDRTDLAPLDPVPQAQTPQQPYNSGHNTFDPRYRNPAANANSAGNRSAYPNSGNHAAYAAPDRRRAGPQTANGWQASPRYAGDDPWKPAPANRYSAAPASAGSINPDKAAPVLKTITASPKSETLRGLLAHALQARPNPSQSADRYEAARLDALLRLGFPQAASHFQIPAGINQQSPDWAGFALRRSIARAALDRPDEACANARDIVASADKLPAKDKDRAILLSGYCADHQKNTAAIRLAADVARDRSGFSPAAIAALEALAQSSKPRIPAGLELSALSYRMLLKAGADPGRLVSAKHSSLLLVTMANDASLPPALQIAAAEKAAADFLISSETLAKAYRKAPAAGGTDLEQLHSGARTASPSPALHRASLYMSAVRQQTPLQKVRLIREFLDKSAKAGLYFPALQLMAEPVSTLSPIPEIGWFAETAIEALLAAGDPARARDWAHLAETSDPRGPRALEHWQALIDIADPSRSARRGEGLASVERMALRGNFQPADLHRLATVLDALDYQVPIPLWEAASRTPQPSDGHLPPTGVLSQLQEAAKSGDSAWADLLVLDAIGPDGPRGAHIISLGDSIRALKRMGMEKEARRIGFEALFKTWPRAAQG